MSDRHFAFWPAQQSHHLTVPETSLWTNAEVAAQRYPNKPYILYYDTPLSFAEFRDEAEKVAGYLMQVCKVQRGDRVLLYMQNSPQFAIAYYGILRANAVVVPVNPMNLTGELRHYVQDTGASCAIVAQELFEQIAPLMKPHADPGLDHVLVAAYSDYLKRPTDLRLPDIVSAPRKAISAQGVTLWSDMLRQNHAPGPLLAGPEDLCVMPYTSGTTGNPKGCMHTHRSAMANAVGTMQWFNATVDSIGLAVLPFFHVTGMQGALNGPIFLGSSIVLLTRWDREVVARCIERYRIASLQVITTMVVDLLAYPKLSEYDLSSLRGIRGGGAAMPEALAQKLKDITGLPFVEGYGLSETIAASHINPPDRPKKQCLGIPIYGVDSRVVDPVDFRELPVGEVGEIVTHGPNVMQGYWNNPQATRDIFIEIDGKRFLRTGDLGRIDEDGYFFMVDRLKRMINASGYKVWPAEVEALLYQHPAIQEACVIAAYDPRRGETVKAVVVLRDGFRGKVTEDEIVAWAHDSMASYKSPRIVEFVDVLPKSSTGKVQWRALQEKEKA